MSNPWTPGPWRAERAPFNPNQWAVQSQFLHVNGLTAWHVVATVFGADKAEEASTGGAYHSEQAEPNARLIAAAPEMAEALADMVEIVDYIERSYGRRFNPPTVDNARALLARIRGDEAA